MAFSSSTLLLLIAVALSEHTAPKPCPAIVDMNEKSRLLMVQCIPIGSTPDEVGKFVPGFGVGGPYAGDPTLTVGSTPLEVLGQKTRLQFDFKSDSLYAMWYGLDLTAAHGDSLFAELVRFYCKQFGSARIGDGQDAEYYVRNRRWCTAQYEVVVSCSLAGDRRFLGWGFQTSAVSCRRRERSK